MSHFLDRLTFFIAAREPSPTATASPPARTAPWEDAYRNRWAHDKIVRSHARRQLHRLVLVEDLRQGRHRHLGDAADRLPAHALGHAQPRAARLRPRRAVLLVPVQRNRVKYPMVRGRLLNAGARPRDRARSRPGRIVEDRQARRDYQQVRGLGGFVRVELGRGQRDRRRRQHPHHQEAWPGPHHRLLADPGDVDGQLRRGQPLPVADRRRLHELLRLVCDLPPSSPQTWGEQTDVPESADWYNSRYIIAWGSNVPQTRTPDAHSSPRCATRVQNRAVTPDYSEVIKIADLWPHPKQGTDAALAMAMGHVILRSSTSRAERQYFDDYARRYSDMPSWCSSRRRKRYYKNEQLSSSKDEQNTRIASFSFSITSIGRSV